MHTCGFYPVADLTPPTELILLWASNPHVHERRRAVRHPVSRTAQKGRQADRGRSRKTELAEKADRWLQLRPGTAQALALGFIHVIIEESLYDKDFVEKYTSGFEDLTRQVKDYTPEKVAEITWVPADLIREAARMYAKAKPAALQWGTPSSTT
jgi:anaerobic selenocysteine-containing dehydrogenase